VLVSAKTLLRNDAQLTAKLAAIANAFQATGIVDRNP
jgi:hypothetical protein